MPSFNKEVCTTYFKKSFEENQAKCVFPEQSWIPRFYPPSSSFNTKPPTYREVTNVIKKMKSSGCPCPLDQIPILVFKHCPHLRSYLTAVLEQVWESGKIPEVWKKATTILIHKKESCEDPANFRPITLESVPLNILTSLIRNKMFSFLSENQYVEHKVQKGFAPKVSETFEHTSQMSYLINHARIKRRSLVITLLDLKNAFGKVNHSLITEVLNYHHMPEEIQKLISSLYTDFHISVITKSFATPFILVVRAVWQGDPLSPLTFNLIFNTFIRYIKSERFEQLGYRYNNILTSKHWFQFLDDAAVVTGLESENQVLLNAFSCWCNWLNMIIRVDKCCTFGIRKIETSSIQYLPKLFVNNEIIPVTKDNENFIYLSRSFIFKMDNNYHKLELVSNTKEFLEKISSLPLHPRNKLLLYNNYVLSKPAWHLTIADFGLTWVKHNLDTLLAYFVRSWLEIPVSATIDIVLLSKDKFGL